MVDVTVNPGALRAKAGYDVDRAEVIDGLKQQIAKARATEDCFGLIGMTAGLFTGYDRMVDDVEENVGLAAEYLRSSAERLNDSADEYGQIDDGWAGAFGQASTALSDSTFGKVGAGRTELPKLDSAAPLDKAKEAVGEFQDASSLPEVFVAGVQVKREADQLLAHPMQGFWDNGLGFLVEWCMIPFRPLFEQVTGDPDQMRSTGGGWAKMAQFVNGLADADATEQQGLLKFWDGDAAKAQDKQKKEFQDGLRALANTCLQLQDHLNQVADFFEGLWDILVDIVREFVEFLIITWLAALATSAISFGASVAAAWSTSVARVSMTLSKILMQISKALRWLVKMMGKIQDLAKAVKQWTKAQSFLVRQGLRMAGVTPTVNGLARFGPMGLLVQGATGLTGDTAKTTARESATELITDQALDEAAEYASGEVQQNQQNEEAMQRGFS